MNLPLLIPLTVLAISHRMLSSLLSPLDLLIFFSYRLHHLYISLSRALSAEGDGVAFFFFVYSFSP